MSSSSFDSPLFVCYQRRRYQPATVDQIFEAARSVIGLSMRRDTTFSDPSVAGRSALQTGYGNQLSGRHEALFGR